MEVIGNLRKMHTQLADEVLYTLPLGEHFVPMNDLIGRSIQIEFNGVINCRICDRKIPKAFGEGMCYPCFANAPENSECIIFPEKCLAHEGKGRDVAWEKEHHIQPHYVYISLTAGSKVGVTRHDQIPTRWIDQGAVQAIKIAETPYRQLAGAIEVSLKEHFADKTKWQRMLKNEIESIDLLQEAARAIALLPDELKQYALPTENVQNIPFPVVQYPTKVSSVNLLKINAVEAKLVGIKGQYLLFDTQQVLNIRKHTGYQVRLVW